LPNYTRIPYNRVRCQGNRYFFVEKTEKLPPEWVKQSGGRGVWGISWSLPAVAVSTIKLLCWMQSVESDVEPLEVVVDFQGRYAIMEYNLYWW